MGRKSQPTDPQNQQKSYAYQSLQERIEQAGDARESEILADVVAVQHCESRKLGALLHVGAHHAHSREILLHAAADIRKHALNRFEAIVDAPAEKQYGQAHQRRWRQRHQSQRPVYPQHHRHGQHQRQRSLAPVHDARSEHHAYCVHVVGGARQDVARANATVEIRIKRDQPPEQLVAEIVLDVARDPDQDHPHPVLEEALDSRSPGQDSAETEHHAQRNAGRQRVNGSAHHQRQRRAKEIFHHQRAESQRETASITP